MTKQNPTNLDLWKERFRTPEIMYARIAYQNPERGFIIANIDEKPISCMPGMSQKEKLTH